MHQGGGGGLHHHDRRGHGVQDDDRGGVQVDEGEGLRPSAIFLPPTGTQVGFCDKIVSSLPRSRGHGHVNAVKPDPIGDLIRGVGEGVAKIVGDLERSLQKLVDPKVLLTSNNIARVSLQGLYCQTEVHSVSAKTRTPPFKQP